MLKFNWFIMPICMLKGCLKMNPKIDIIMGVYNCEATLEESIDSILAQTYTNWHFIICDDCSKDRSYELLQKYKDQYPDRFTLLQNEKNMGLNYTLNRCLEECTGEFIARMDGDDISLPTRFEREMEILKDDRYALVCCAMTTFDEEGDYGVVRSTEVPTANDFRAGSPFTHATAIIRKKVMDEVGGYSVADHLLRVEDYHLWFKIYAKGYLGYNLQEPLYKMRNDKNAIRRRNFKNRINETRLKFWGFRKIGVSLKYYPYILKPFILALIPTWLYTILHRSHLQK